MFYIFRPLRFEVWITLVGSGVIVMLAILAASSVYKGFRLPVNTALDDIWYSVRMVLAQSEIIFLSTLIFTRFSFLNDE